MLRLLTVSLLLAATATAQPVTVSGEIRHRSEADDRDVDRSRDATAIHLLRTRLGVEARPAPRVRAFVQIQDSRLWGGENPALALGTLDGSADALDLHQAYFDLDSLGGQPLAVRVGRQELAYGNQRLVGSVGWSNVGRSFDAARLRWASGGLTADVFAAQLVSAAAAGGAQALLGVFAAWTPEAGPLAGQTAELSLFVDADDERLAAGPHAGARLRQRTTLGLRAHGARGPLGYDAELAVQRGAMVASPEAKDARNDVRAWLVSGEVSAGAGPVTLGAGATRLSGDADPGDGVDRRFDTLFATNHTFYGAMDYFPRFLGAGGLDDLYVTASARPARLWRVGGAVHSFASAVGDRRPLGTELDVSAGYTLAPEASVGLGVSVFRSSETFGDGETTTWAFLTTRVGF